MIFGTTYSHLQTRYLGLDHNEIFPRVLDFGFDLIRLCLYWNQIEKKAGVYDFDFIKSLLQECQQRNQDVAVTVGMKAPRWPEYFLPAWLNNYSFDEITPHVFRFITAAINTLAEFSCIKYWQVENEPLDPGGPDNQKIPYELLLNETAVVKRLDKRPVMLTLWGNELSQRQLLPSVIPLADIIGLDFYYRRPIIPYFYRGPQDSDKALTKLITNCPKNIWITELQAEPWEWNKITTDEKYPKSMNTTILADNYKRAQNLNPKGILFWGFEYWYWKKKNGDGSHWQTAKSLISYP